MHQGWIIPKFGSAITMAIYLEVYCCNRQAQGIPSFDDEILISIVYNFYIINPEDYTSVFNQC